MELGNCTYVGGTVAKKMASVSELPWVSMANDLRAILTYEARPRGKGAVA